MLSNHTHERLVALGLAGMAKALDDQQRQPDVTALTFEQRLGLMIDREATERENKRLVVRLKFASLRQTAIVEDVDLRRQPPPRWLGLHAQVWVPRKPGSSSSIGASGPRGEAPSRIALLWPILTILMCRPPVRCRTTSRCPVLLSWMPTLRGCLCSRSGLAGSSAAGARTLTSAERKPV
jgi:hypothetical protein